MTQTQALTADNRSDSREPQTALPAMLVGSGLSLLLWTFIVKFVWAVAQ